MKLFIGTLAACLAFGSVVRAQFDDAGDGGRGGDRGGWRGGDGGPGGGFRGGPGGRGGFPNVLLEALDADGDEIISSVEIRRAAAALAKLDKNDDGRITQDELQPDPNEMADRMFTNADQNGDGQITPDEAQGPMSFMLRDADEDGDGAISKDEYKKTMEQIRERFQGGPGGGPVGPGGGPGGPGGGPGGFSGGAGGGADGLMSNDRNGDGKLSPQEVPEQLMGLLKGGDTNRDGQIDRRELGDIMRRRAEEGGGRFGGGRGGPPDGGDGK